jgi:catechol-2,3-dioxygenase
MNLHRTLIHQRHKTYTRTWRPVERERGHINLVTSHVEAADDFFLTANGFRQPSIMRLPDLPINTPPQSYNWAID